MNHLKELAQGTRQYGEVVVHRGEEPLAVLGDLLEQGAESPGSNSPRPAGDSRRSNRKPVNRSNRSNPLKKVCKPRFNSSSRVGP